MDGAVVSGGFLDNAVDAEAAAWVARLQSGETESAEAGLQQWLQADPAHVDAFERATEIWAMLPGAALCSQAEKDARARSHAEPEPRPRQRHAAFALVALLVLLLAGGVLATFGASPGYSTERGEQRTATLNDGSRIVLNTDSRLDVDFTTGMRRVRLDRGEAMFEVAPDADRPFIVTAGDTQVRAIGTVFIVRRDGDSVVVTLIKGKVAVSDIAAPQRGRTPVPAAELSPGERLTASTDGPAIVEPESIEAATAWRRGQAIFRETPLASAVAELNRYGGPRLEVADPHVAALPVSGVFATNDTPEFAEAVAQLHGLHVEKDGDTLRISR